MQPRLLVIDSDQAHAASCLVMLEREGFAVECVFAFEEAVEAFRRTRPDAVIVETIVDGGDCSPILRDAARRGIPAFSMSDLAVGAINAKLATSLDGALALWEKPLHRDEVLAGLRHAMGDRFPSPAPPVGAASVAATVERPTAQGSAAMVDEEATVEAALAMQGDEPTDVTRAPAPPVAAEEPSPAAGHDPHHAETQQVAQAAPEPVPWVGFHALDGPAVAAVGGPTEVVFGALLGSWARALATGVLELRAGSREAAIRFESGDIVGLRIGGVADLALEVLLADGLLRSDIVDALVRNLPPGQTLSAEFVVEAGVVEADEIARLERIGIRRSLQSWWSVEAVRWAWRPGATDVARIAEPVNVADLVWEAATFLLDPSETRQALQHASSAELAWRPDMPQTPLTTRYGWTRRVAASIDAGQTVGAVLAMGPLPVATLYALIALGLAGARSDT